MIKVKLFGLFRERAEKYEYELDAPDVALAVKALADKTGVAEKTWKQGVMFVNRVPIEKLSMYKTRLRDGDELAILSPASGG